ncbi:unnamed protein product [Chrysoparadoxa australica]
MSWKVTKRILAKAEEGLRESDAKRLKVAKQKQKREKEAMGGEDEGVEKGRGRGRDRRKPKQLQEVQHAPKKKQKRKGPRKQKSLIELAEEQIEEKKMIGARNISLMTCTGRSSSQVKSAAVIGELLARESKKRAR